MIADVIKTSFFVPPPDNFDVIVQRVIAVATMNYDFFDGIYCSLFHSCTPPFVCRFFPLQSDNLVLRRCVQDFS
jgi:hypothetical protein